VTELQQRLAAIQSRIETASKLANRSPKDVTLIVVTKNHEHTLVTNFLEIGVRDFGENRNQEAEPKAKAILAETSLAREEYRWHFIGQLQSNKVKNVLNYADVLHSLDRASLLEALVKELTKQERTLDVFIQLNLTDNPERGGIHPSELAAFAERVLQVEKLKLRGVMGVAALDGQAERDFETIRNASDVLLGIEPTATAISAGMSEDFEVAIQYGATHLRIGTAITGKRQY
jgi:hypothetical protein